MGEHLFISYATEDSDLAEWLSLKLTGEEYAVWCDRFKLLGGESYFLIPLNVDGLKPTELDWMTSDITFIPFHKSWAKGLAQLLKKLDSIDAPRPVKDGKAIACQYISQPSNPRRGTGDSLLELFGVLENT